MGPGFESRRAHRPSQLMRSHSLVVQAFLARRDSSSQVGSDGNDPQARLPAGRRRRFLEQTPSNKEVVKYIFEGTEDPTARPNVIYDTTAGLNMFRITEDRAYRVLQVGWENARRARDWLAPLSLTIAIGLGLTTTTSFRDAFGVPRQFWEAAWYLGLVVSLGWLIRAVLFIPRPPSVEEMLNALKMGQPVVTKAWAHRLLHWVGVKSRRGGGDN